MFLVTSVDLSSFDEKGYAYNINFILLFQFYLSAQNPHPLRSQLQKRGRFEKVGWEF